MDKYKKYQQEKEKIKNRLIQSYIKIQRDYEKNRIGDEETYRKKVEYIKELKKYPQYIQEEVILQLKKEGYD